MHPLSPLAGQGWLQLGELALAFLLSALVGLERELRQKAAGLRTYSLVGVSAALFVLVSKHGFTNVLDAGRIVLDPSRIAAQVVSGIGFIGGGVIFMRRNVVRGLTTAASVWLTAAPGMACGAGLPVLAAATAAGHFAIMLAFPRLVARFLPGERRTAARLRLLYEDRRGRLRDILLACSALRFSIDHVEVERVESAPPAREDWASEAARDLADLEGTDPGRSEGGAVALAMQLRGRKPIADLVLRLSELDGVIRVGTVEDDLD